MHAYVREMERFTPRKDVICEAEAAPPAAVARGPWLLPADLAPGIAFLHGVLVWVVDVHGAP